MAESPYLVQALQGMGQQPQNLSYSAPSIGQLQQMQHLTQQRQAWEAANPGQSYAMHGLAQLGQNVMNVPQTLANAGQNIAGLPGDAMSGLRNLMGKIPGMGPQAAQYGGTPDYSNFG